MVGRKTKSCAGSAEIGPHTLAAPVRSAPFCHVARAGSAGSRGTGSHAQTSVPVRALYPRTTPEGISTRSLSLMAEPTTTTSPTTAGADVKWYSPGMTWSIPESRLMPAFSETWPAVPNPAQAFPVSRIHRDQAAVQRGFVNHPPARRSRLEFGIDPARQSSAGEVVTVITNTVELRIKSPLLLPRLRIQRDNAVERSRDVERAVNHQGRCLKRALGPHLLPVPSARPVRHVAGAIRPRHLEHRQRCL